MATAEQARHGGRVAAAGSGVGGGTGRTGRLGMGPAPAQTPLGLSWPGPPPTYIQPHASLPHAYADGASGAPAGVPLLYSPPVFRSQQRHHCSALIQPHL